MEINSEELFTKIQQASSFDLLVKFHEDFLTKTLCETLLMFDSNPAADKSTYLYQNKDSQANIKSNVFLSVTKILSTCVLFCNALRDFVERFLIKND